MPKDLRDTVKIGNRRLELTSVDKLYFPEAGYKKGEVINYYREVSSTLLPHLKNRPVTLKRYPEGVGGKHFYQKDAPDHTPSWIQTVTVARKETKGGSRTIDYLLLNNKASLIWSVNLGNIEMHAFLAKAPRLERPTSVVFDLDPGPGAGLLQCGEVALSLRSLFDTLELESFVKVSGSKGMQLYVPLNSAVEYSVTRPFAKAVAEYMEQQRPALVVSKMSKELRRRKVLIDWSQNDDSKSTVIVYSLRAKSAQPYVSMPVEWQELERALKRGDAEKLYFTPRAALKRLDKKGDIFEQLLTLRQRLPKEFRIAAVSNARNASSLRPKKTKSARKGTDMEAYRAKRDFKQTAEPPPKVRRPKKRDLRFVIQKHQAGHLHYDFRLEMEGVLRSWAVPKGPSTVKGERRLAMHVEDHPLDYAEFEGTIAPGNYGAGTVMVWDRGRYESELGDPAAEYRNGKLHLSLEGEKLSGSWALVRAAGSTGDDKRWFLIKTGEDAKKISAKRDDQSAVSGRTMKQIAKENTAQWESNREKKKRRA